jgi:hypothetical protein
VSHSLQIELIPGNIAPRYPIATEIFCQRVVITEQGTEGGLPIVDFVCQGATDQQFIFTLTGRIVNAIAAAVRGINQRNHGIEEP